MGRSSSLHTRISCGYFLLHRWGSQGSPQPTRAAPAAIRQHKAAVAEGACTKDICPSGKSSSVFFLPIIIDEDGVIESRLLFPDEIGYTRQRRGCFIGVIHRSQCVEYFAVIERDLSGQPPIVLLVESLDIKYALRKLLISL